MASCIAIWDIEFVGVAPCQCSSSGGIHTVSPTFIILGCSFLNPTRPVPLIICSVWPRGCVCHAVRAPGSNETFNAWTLAGYSASIIGYCHTVPVNHSEEDFLVGFEPALNISNFYPSQNWLLDFKILCECTENAIWLLVHQSRNIF